jgi:hypothetical protein
MFSGGEWAVSTTTQPKPFFCPGLQHVVSSRGTLENRRFRHSLLGKRLSRRHRRLDPDRLTEGRIIFCPSASLTHHEVPSGGCHVADVVGETRDISWEVNNFLFYLKNLPRHRLLPIAFVHVLSAIEHGNGPRGVLKRASRSWLAFRRAQEISTTDPLLVRSAPIS